MRVFWTIAASIAGTGLAAAEDIPVPPFLGDAKTYCAEYFGAKVLRPVSARGYSRPAQPFDPCDYGCYISVALGLFDFIEISIGEENEQSHFDEESAFPAPGSYRVSKYPAGSVACAKTASMADRYDHHGEKRAAGLDTCVGVEVVDEPLSEYVVERTSPDIGIPRGEGTTSRLQVVERATGTVLATNSSMTITISASDGGFRTAPVVFACAAQDETAFLHAALAADRQNPVAAFYSK